MKLAIAPNRLKPFIRAIKLLGKHSETITFSCTPTKLLLQVKNDSSTAFIEVTFKKDFFTEFIHVQNVQCNVPIKSLALVFKTKNFDLVVDLLKISMSPADDRLSFKMRCKNGVLRQYLIPCSDCLVTRYPDINRSSLPTLQAPAKVYLEMLRNFPSSTFEATMWLFADQLRFKSFIEVDGDQSSMADYQRGQPVTMFAYGSNEFSHFHPQPDQCITCNIWDLKTFLEFASMKNNDIRAYFQASGQPIEFILKDTGEHIVARMILATIAFETDQMPQPPPPDSGMVLVTSSQQQQPPQQQARSPSVTTTDVTLECDMTISNESNEEAMEGVQVNVDANNDVPSTNQAFINVNSSLAPPEAGHVVAVSDTQATFSSLGGEEEDDEGDNIDRILAMLDRSDTQQEQNSPVRVRRLSEKRKFFGCSLDATVTPRDAAVIAPDSDLSEDDY